MPDGCAPANGTNTTLAPLGGLRFHEPCSPTNAPWAKTGPSCWPRPLHPDVHMLAEVTVRPAVESTLANRGDVVRDQVTADLVALVDRGPQRPAPRVERDPDGVAQAAGELARRAGARVDLPDRGA